MHRTILPFSFYSGTVRSFVAFFLLGFALVSGTTGFAQTTATIGTASSTASILGPTTSTLSGARTERHTAIYSAAELSAAGMSSGSTIFSIAWDKTGAGSYTNTDLTFRIWLKHNSATSFAANPSFATETGSATLVYETTSGTIPAATGLVRFIFNMNTFAWNGTENIQVITEIVRPGSWTNSSFNWRTIATVTNGAANSNGAAAVDAMTRGNTRPQVVFEIAAPGNDAALTGMPNPLPGSPGGQAVDVVLRNTGNVALTTATITWSVNGGAPTTYNWAGLLNPGESATVSVGSFIFNVGSNTVTASVSSPNGASDLNPANDQVSKAVVICTPLIGNYTIDKNAPTLGTNYNSFTDFATALAGCGVTGNVVVNVVANSGPYNEQVDFRNITGLGGGSTVTVNGNGNTLTATTTLANRYVMRFYNVSYFTINNLIVAQGAFTTGWIGVHLFGTCSNITLNGMQINMNPSTSVLVGGIVGSGDTASFIDGGVFSDITYTNNTITGGGKGINIYGVTGNLVSNLVISNNTINQTGADGIFISATTGAEIRNNELNISSGDGIEIYFNTSNTNVYANKVSATNAASTGTIKGITLPSNNTISGAKIYNNLIWKMQAPGANIYGLSSGATGASFLFNTVILDNTSATGNIAAGFFEDGTNTGTILRNNIFYISRPGAAWSTVYSLGSSSTVATAITANNNVFFIPSGIVANRRQTTTANPPAATYTLTDWRTASGEDVNSFATDPFFQPNTAIPTSGIINDQADGSTGITTDITGAPRSSLPDPGAYEFSPPVVDAAVTGFALPARPFCGTTLPVEFVLTNAGAVTLTSATINWSINGVAQTPYNWTGSLASGASVNVSLGNATLSGNTAYDFIATVVSANGSADANAANNSFTYNGFRGGMNGAYTLNSSQPASSSNYVTFQKLSEDLSFYGVCGPMVVTVSGGPYTEQVVFNAIGGTSATNTVTINGNGQTLQFNPTVASNDHVLQLNGVNYIIVENLIVNSTNATQGRGIHVTNNASNLIIRNNTVNVSLTNTTSSSFGIIVSGSNWLLDGSLSENITISGNTITGGYSGIQITGENFNSAANKVRNSFITNNTVKDFYGFGIYLNYTDNVVVSKNRVSRPARTNSGSDSQTPAAIIVSAGSTSFLLEKNTIADLYNTNMSATELLKISRGFYIGGTSTAVSTGTLQNNLVYGSSNTGTQYALQDNTSGNGNSINIYHNTFALNNQTMTGLASSTVLNFSGSSAGGTRNIQNNIFYLTRSGTGAKQIIDASSASTPFTFNYNVYHIGTTTGTVQFAQLGATNYSDFRAWQLGTGNDANGVEANPTFADEATGNFRPMNGVVDGTAMATSVVGGITDDILDAARSVNPDPGAYESSTPTPVSLYLFSGNRTGNINELRWTTASESNNRGFNLERSEDGVNYTAIAFVASLSVTGNSNSPLNYVFTDQTFSGDKQWYRLKQLDRSGQFSYSKVVLIKGAMGRGVQELTGVYPNPVSGTTLNVLLYSPQNSAVNMQIIDVTGRTVAERKLPVGIGNNTLPLSVTELSKGLYLIKIRGSESETLRFIKE